jgi:hypothetical protein
MAAAHIGALVAVEAGDILAIDPDRPAGWLVKAADQLQQGGLAGAGRADQGGKFAVFDGQVDAAQSLRLQPPTLIDTDCIFNFYDFHFILLFRSRAYFSARRASTGCKREAIMAGYRPAKNGYDEGQDGQVDRTVHRWSWRRSYR